MIDVKRITSVLMISVNGQDLILDEKQAEDLCISLEQMLFDDPTYDELSNENSCLRAENERLKEGFESLNANFEDKLTYKLGRRYI